MDHGDFIREYERVRQIAYELARLQALAGLTNAYPEEEMGMSVTAEGAYFFDQEEDQYDEGHYYTVSILVSWDDIDDPVTATARLKEAVEYKKRNEAKAREEWERGQYERLRGKFEPQR